MPQSGASEKGNGIKGVNMGRDTRNLNEHKSIFSCEDQGFPSTGLSTLQRSHILA